MIRRRRLAAAVGLVAAALLAGRVLAVLHGEHAWYQALGAESVWRERTRDAIALHLGLAVVAAAFAAANISAMRRSIMSLTLPRRLANVEFGEAVPPVWISRAAIVLSLVVAVLMGFMAPSWLSLSTARSGVPFGERDPYFQLDLGFFASWLPLERAVFDWSLVLLALVTAMVVGLYSLTPGLRLHRGRLRVSVHARRHVSALAALALLLLAWSYRLDAYDALVSGRGAGGAFTYIDHEWMVPAYLFMGIATVAAAALVLAAGWNGQARTSFLTLTAVLVLSLTTLHLVPFLMEQASPAALQRARNRPYAATREAFTRRAYGQDAKTSAPPSEVSTPGLTLDSAAIDGMLAGYAGGAIVYPGAAGTIVVGDSAGIIAAPSLGSGIGRVAHAWSQQDLGLLSGDLSPDARLVSIRDVRERISTLVPALAQGSVVTPMFRADSLYWVLELYSSSRSYPLSAHHRIAGESRAYFRHAATAAAHSGTGRVTVFPVASPDPIAAAWIRRHGGVFAPPARSWLRELSLTPPPRRALAGAPLPQSDSSFRARVTALYNRMRAALVSGDLAAFGAAYDSLGFIVAQPGR